MLNDLRKKKGVHLLGAEGVRMDSFQMRGVGFGWRPEPERDEETGQKRDSRLPNTPPPHPTTTTTRNTKTSSRTPT